MDNFHKDVKKEDKNEYKKIAIISREQEEVIIGMLKDELNKEKEKKQKQKKEKEKEKEKFKQSKNNKNDKFEIDDEELES
jgi:hypothetical protein